MVTNAPGQVDTDFLQGFSDAGNDHDIDALMSFMTDDCEFYSSMGPDVYGTRYIGREKVRAALLWYLETFPDGQWRNARHFVSGDRGVSEWTFTATSPDGGSIEVNGCDIFTFKGGRIAVKNSFRKNRAAS